MTDLGLACVISTSTGSLDLAAAPYDLEASTRSQMGVRWRKTHAENTWVEGEVLTSAVRGNVEETLGVWVEAASAAVRSTALRELIAALEQLSYTIAFTSEGITETWTCEPAEYQIDERAEYRHGGLVLVKATVPRKPTVVLS